MSNKSKWRLCCVVMACFTIGTYLPDCTDPNATCLIAVETAAKAIVRCEPNTDLDTTKQKLLETWALGDCRLIKKIRDIKGLTNDCLPWLSNVSCVVLQSGRQPPACQNQLLFSTDEF